MRKHLKSLKRPWADISFTSRAYSSHHKKFPRKKNQISYFRFFFLCAFFLLLFSWWGMSWWVERAMIGSHIGGWEKFVPLPAQHSVSNSLDIMSSTCDGRPSTDTCPFPLLLSEPEFRVLTGVSGQLSDVNVQCTSLR